jgi:hypothetical protein
LKVSDKGGNNFVRKVKDHQIKEVSSGLIFTISSTNSILLLSVTSKYWDACLNHRNDGLHADQILVTLL